MAEDKSKILAEQLLQIEGMGYDDKFRLYTEAIREHDKAIREEIESECKAKIERASPIVVDRDMRIPDKKILPDGTIIPEWLSGMVNKQFDNEEIIGED